MEVLEKDGDLTEGGKREVVMYFIRYKQLKNRLRSRSVTDREALPYLILSVAIAALVSAPPPGTISNLWDCLSALFSAATAVGGILYAYHKNGGRSGFDLIQKFVIIGWVVTIRFALVFIPIAIVIIIAGTKMGVISLDYTGPYDILMILVAEIIFYQRIGKHVGDTAEEVSEQERPLYP